AKPIEALAPFRPTLSRSWPVGTRYSHFCTPPVSEYHAWAEFKLAAAAWYLEALEELQQELHELDRSTGVEMAIDGLLAAACSAFDAAVAGLITAIEAKPGKLPTPEHRYSWTVVQRHVTADPRLSIASADEIDTAL